MSKRPAEVIAHIYVIYFKASLFPLTFAPGPQQDQLTVSTSYASNTCIAEPREARGGGGGGEAHIRGGRTGEK